jgi:hypothetical protein
MKRFLPSIWWATSLPFLFTVMTKWLPRNSIISVLKIRLLVLFKEIILVHTENSEKNLNVLSRIRVTYKAGFRLVIGFIYLSHLVQSLVITKHDSAIANLPSYQITRTC